MRFDHVRGSDGGVVTMCARESEDGALIGLSMSAPGQNWNRKKGNAIARGRAHDSPLHLRFSGLEEQLSHRHIFLAVVLVSAGPLAWVKHSETPLRPGRFTCQYQSTLLGPGGSLIYGTVDGKAPEPSNVLQGTWGGSDLPRYRVRHWIARVPSWAHDLLQQGLL